MKQPPPKNIHEILENTVNVLEESKKDIFDIAESSRQEVATVKEELGTVNREINEIIDKLTRLEKVNKKARIKLMEVSRDFKHCTEADIKKAYEKAEKTSVEIAVLNEKEKQLKSRRRGLEKRIINMDKIVERAENLVSRMGVARDYLFGRLSNLNEQFNDLQEKQKVALKVIRSQEEERKRVAREIHDGPAQSLANLVFRVEVSQQLIDQDIEKAKNELDELKKIVRLSVQDVRKIIFDLRPMSLDDLGLIPTLKRYINKFIEQTGIMVDLRVLGNERRLPTSHEVTIFRLVQEALNNIYKHAQASYSRVSLEFTSAQINILVSDDGCGFAPEEIKDDSFGLVSMRERCNLLDGSIDINSNKNEGTRIKISIPVEGGK